MSVVQPVRQPVGDSVAKINDEVAVGEDLGFQRRWWQFERAVWLLFVLIIVLDLAGAFGRGPLAKAAAQSPDHALEVTYERIQRSGTPSMMTVHLNGPALQSGFVDLSLSDSAVNGLGLQRVIPAPQTSTVGAGLLRYRFPADAPAAFVRFEFEPSAAGIYPLTVAIADDTTLHLHVLVVP